MANTQTPAPISPASNPNTQRYGLPPDIFDPAVNGADWYTITVDAGNSPAPVGAGAILAAGAIANVTYQINKGQDFYLVAISQQSQAESGGTAEGGLEESTNLIPLVTLQINDSGSDRNLFSSPTPVGSIAGDGKRPFRMIQPRVFRGGAVLTFVFTSFDTADFEHLYLTLHGYKYFTG